MDILKKLAESENRDIIITLPKNKTWLEYLTYFLELTANQQFLDIIVESVPKTAKANKCFLTYDGLLRGWMFISRLTETPDNEICIQLEPHLHSSIQKAPIQDIDGWKYFFDNFEMQ